MLTLRGTQRRLLFLSFIFYPFKKSLFITLKSLEPNFATEEPINVYLDKIIITVLTPFLFETNSRFKLKVCSDYCTEHANISKE